MSTPNSYPSVNEMFGRKRKKRTSIETNIRSTLEKRFQDVRGKSFCPLGTLPELEHQVLSRKQGVLGYLFDNRLENPWRSNRKMLNPKKFPIICQ